jgi:hypothetical protein
LRENLCVKDKLFEGKGRFTEEIKLNFHEITLCQKAKENLT